MRALSLVVVLLVGCATNSVKDEDLTDGVRFKHSAPITPIRSDSWSERDAEALNRSVEILRTVTNRLRDNVHK
jgi:uncharacterized protein YcfL